MFITLQAMCTWLLDYVDGGKTLSYCEFNLQCVATVGRFVCRGESRRRKYPVFINPEIGAESTLSPQKEEKMHTCPP